MLSVSGLGVSTRGPDEMSLVRNVSFSIGSGQTTVIVGESGSGKTLTCNAIAGLLSPRLQLSGEISLDGRSLSNLSERDWSAIRGNDIGYVFQNPFSTMNPVQPIGRQVGEALRQHRRIGRTEALREARRLLDLVQIPAAEKRLHDYPHQLSGGMLQRVAIAMAIACRPKLLIADEPTTALDVTVQAEIIQLLKQLQRERSMAMLVVTHNLGVAAQIAQDVIVMYGGAVMERGSATQVLSRAQHPYTIALLKCAPQNARFGQPLYAIPGMVPKLGRASPNCAFASRCERALPSCTRQAPPRYEVGVGHHAFCARLTPEELTV